MKIIWQGYIDLLSKWVFSAFIPPAMPAYTHKKGRKANNFLIWMRNGLVCGQVVIPKKKNKKAEIKEVCSEQSTWKYP